MPFIYTYLVEDNGDYVYDNEGNRIVLSSYEYSTSGFNWQRIASSVRKPQYIRSFRINKFDDGDTWVLIVNQKQLVGREPDMSY